MNIQVFKETIIMINNQKNLINISGISIDERSLEKYICDKIDMIRSNLKKLSSPTKK